MTFPRTETTTRPDDSAEKPQRTQLSAVQVTASALAAVSSAVVASFFGVAGTLIGAALASVITTVSAALYSSSLQKSKKRLRQVHEQLTQREAPAVEVADAAPATRVLPAHLDPRRPPARRRRPRWPRVAAYAVGVFAIAMGIVTGVEAIGQQPVSALVGNSQTSGTTTIGALTNASSHRDAVPSTPLSPTTAPETSTSAPTSSPAETSTPEAPESGSDDSGSATPTPSTSSPNPSRTSDGHPSAQPSRSSADAPETSSTPAPGVESTP